MLAAVLVAALLGGVTGTRPPGPRDRVDAYVAAWTSGDYSTLDQWATSAFYTEGAENLGGSVEVTTGKRWWTGTATVPFTATFT